MSVGWPRGGDGELALSLGRAAAGDDAAWRRVVASTGPVVRGYLRAVGEPEVDQELTAVFADVADDLDAYVGTPREFVISLFDVAIDRQRRLRRPVASPERTPQSAPGFTLDADVRDAVLLDRLVGLDDAESASLLQVPRDVVVAWRDQGAAQIADDNWGRS